MSRAWLNSVMSGRITHPASFHEPQPQEDDRPGLEPNASRGLAYVCARCGWTGTGGVKAFDHHRIDHHDIELRDLPGRTVSFSCCETADGRCVDAEGCRKCSADVGEPCAPWCGER